MNSPTAPSRDTDNFDLSVVIVSRNEEAHILECIATTLVAIEEARRAGVVRTTEVLLVDSASTDRTVEIARSFPVDVVQLGRGWPLSCGAGCYTGFRLVRGMFVAIVNADMTIDARWFVDALPRLSGDVGGVLGVAKENLAGATFVERALLRFMRESSPPGTVPDEIRNHSGGFSAGTLLLRSDAAKAVGPYHPFLVAAEDLDLRHRLQRAGWKVLNLPVLQGTHYWAAPGAPIDIAEYVRMISRNSTGLGQVARYYLRSASDLARRAAQPCLNAGILINGLRALILLGILAVNLLAAASLRLDAALIAAAIDALLIGVLAQGGRRTRVRLVDHTFDVLYLPAVHSVARVLGFVQGLVRSPRRPDEYPYPPRFVSRRSSPATVGDLTASENG